MLANRLYKVRLKISDPLIRTIKFLPAIALLLSSPTVLALSTNDLDSIYTDSVWYDSSASSSISANTGDICLGLRYPSISDKAKIAQTINAFFERHAPGGYLNGLGQQIVDGAERQGVNPFLIVGIAGVESEWTLTAPAQAIAKHNAFGNLTQLEPTVIFRTWPSWELSVNDPAGDDEPSLIKNTYLSDPKVVDLLTFAAKYLHGSADKTAPTQYGNPPGYAEKLTNTMSELISESGTAISCGGAGAGSASASSIVQFALLYAWPTEPNTAPDYRNPLLGKPEYLAAPPTSLSSRGADCGIFVATVMVRSGADPNYPAIGTSNQAQYVRTSGKYDVVERVNSTSELLPGDILIVNQGAGSGSSGHTWIYVGPQAGGFFAASASLDSRMPNLGQQELVDYRGYYLRARLK